MSAPLKLKTVGAVKWSFVQEFSQKLLQFAIGVQMTRLLAPEEFGAVAILMVFIVVSQALLESGFGSALVQRKNPTPTDESSVFYFNLAAGLVLAGALSLAAPLVAWFYQLPELTTLLRMMSLILVINGFAVVQNALMVRRLDFRRQAIISVTGTAVSGAVGLTMAWRGFGVWSLVGQQVANSLVRVVMSWLLNAWRPVWAFSAAALRDMFRFGSGMVASVLLNTMFENLYPLVIGKLFPGAPLGFYNRAQHLQQISSQTLSAVANRVTFPVFSRLQDDPERLRNGLRRAMRALVFVQFPMMIGLAAVAEPLILFLFTDKWAASVPLFQALCFVGLLHPMHLLNVNLLMARGRTDWMFRLEVIKRVSLVATLVVTARWGVQAIIWGQVVLNVLSLPLNTYYSTRLANYPLAEQVRDVAPYLVAAALMGVTLLMVPVTFTASPGVVLLVKAALGVALYGGVCLGLGLAAVKEMAGVLRPRGPAVAG